MFVTLDEVRKSYGAQEVIHGATLQIEQGEFCVFVGPSGCGKSTLLRMIAGLEDITDGEIAIDGRVVNDMDPADRGVAMVFQTYALYPHMTVRRNMGFGLRMTGHSRREVADRIAIAAQALQIAELLDRKPANLSGGQRQRVAIGRAIVRNPSVFLFDEPLSNLDAELRVTMRTELAQLHKRLGNTMIYVTHDQIEAMTLADRIVVLRAGVIEQEGTPLTLYDDPANLFVAGFLGSPRMNFMTATVSGGGAVLADGVQVPLPKLTGGLRDGQDIVLGLRPEHMDRAEGDTVSLTRQVILVEELGGTRFVHAQGGGAAPLIIEQRDRAAIGDTVTARFRTADLKIFDPQGPRLR